VTLGPVGFHVFQINWTLCLSGDFVRLIYLLEIEISLFEAKMAIYYPLSSLNMHHVEKTVKT
jgi:hypothetical protein